jgi:hypothetical protein
VLDDGQDIHVRAGEGDRLDEIGGEQRLGL